MILEEYDMDKDAIINPSDFAPKVEGLPKIAVTCFEGETFDRLVQLLQGEVIADRHNANGAFPIYKVNYKGKELAIYMSDMCAAGAGGQIEEIYAMGVETVIMCGSCGVLDRGIGDFSIIIPNAAVRDEGLSYHYAPPSEEIAVNPKYIPEFTRLLDEVGCSYCIGKTWTTDAFYRETKAKMERRKAQGCLCVEMECAAVAAVAQFREKEFFQFFYAADCLDGEAWDQRCLQSGVKFSEGRDRVVQLALELAVRI